MRVGLGNVSLEVEDHGEGVPVVLLHGFPLSSAMWTPIRTAVEEVARLVTPDLRGFGASDKPASGYTMFQLADDVIRLADALALERFVLGGHSMGGYIALRVAADHRDRLAGLVLVDTRAEADTTEGRQRRDAALSRIARGDAEGFLDEFVASLVGESTKTRAPRVLTELRAMAGVASTRAVAGCLAGMRDRPESLSVLSVLGLPALAIVGAEDTVTPVESARAMVAAIAGAELVVVPSSGHTPSMERPIPTAEAILGFLRAHFPRPSVPTPRGPRLQP